jgi:DNA-binding Xre family transcriptional regulator
MNTLSEASRRPTARGRPATSRPVGYRWRLTELMDARGMRSTVELGPLLAERGVLLSDVQVYRLAREIPERLHLRTLAALCDIFDCSPSQLIETYVESGQAPRRRRKTQPVEPSELGTLPPDFRPTRARIVREER